MVGQLKFRRDFAPGMALNSTHDHLSRNAVEMAQNLVQKYLAIQPINIAVIAVIGMPLAGLLVRGLVSPSFGYLPQEDPKEVAAHVPNRSDLSGFLRPNHLRNRCSSLF